MKKINKLLAISILIIFSALAHAKIIELKQKPQQGTAPITIKQKEKKEKISPTIGNLYITEAWNLYNKGKYKEAIPLFKMASKYEDTKLNALFGLACSYINENNDKEAIPILKELVRSNYQLKITTPMLLGILMKEKKYKEARLYLPKLNKEQRKIWKEKIERNILREKLLYAQKRADLKKLIELSHRDELKKCIFPYLYFKTAKILSKKGKKREAIRIYYALLKCCKDEKLRIAVFYELKNMISYKRLDQIIKKDMKDKEFSSSYKKELKKLRLYVLKVYLPSSKDTEKIAKEILAINPNDETTLNILGWWYIKRKRYNEAYKIFLSLYKKRPSEKTAFPLAYVLMRSKRYDEAIRISEKYKSDRFRKLKIGLYFKKATEDYNKRRYNECEFYLKKILSLDPKNKKARKFLAWIFYKEKKIKDALPIFIKERDNPSVAKMFLGIYSKKDLKKAFHYAKKVAKREKTKKISADFFFSHECPITASQIYHDKSTCYFNADSPSAGISTYYRHKKGTSGTSQLNEFHTSYTFSYPYILGKKIDFVLTTKRLSSGSSPDFPYVGKAFRHTLRHNLITSIWAVYPEIVWEKEGYTHYHLKIGTTSLNGPVYPMLTFLFKIKQKNRYIQFYQEPIEESILSYAGLKDPYSEKRWGRVLKLGLEAGETFHLPYSLWLSLKGGYNYIWGRHIWDNHRYFGGMSIGKTYLLKFGKYSTGLFLSAEHFEHNSDYFTYGHGGYFSPKFLLVTGPFFHLQTKKCKTYFYDISIGSGALYYKTKDSPHYPFSPEIGGKYRGKEFFGLGYKIKFLLKKLINPHLEVKFHSDIRRSANYTEYFIGISLSYFAEPLRFLY